jgi:hypothetical protein
MKFSHAVFSKIVLTAISFGSLLSIGCQPQSKVSPFDQMVKDYGYIGFQNSLEQSSTGTMVGGRPTALAFVAHHNDCFPEDVITRHTDLSEFSRKYSYQYKGNLGFLMEGNPLVSAGLGLTKDYTVEIELTNLTMEYMSSIDITDWYLNGMSETCKQYLDDVGFIVQSLITDNMKIKLTNQHGFHVGLDTGNIAQYFQFQAGVSWQIIDDYTVEITTPKYIGYQLGRIRLDDKGRSLYRAMSVENDQFIFEKISLFDLSDNAKNKSLNVTGLSELDAYSQFRD